MSPKSKLILSVVSLIFLSLFLLLVLVWPTSSGIQKISREMMADKEKAANLEARVENTEDFRKFLEEKEGDFKRAEGILIDSEVPIEFIGFLEKVSQDSDIFFKISSGSLNKGADDLWPSISFQVNASGDFSGLSRFLEKIESSPYLVEISNLALNQGGKAVGKEAPQGTLNAALSLKVFTK